MSHKEIENIIFDLGGVIINLDIDATFREFSNIFQKEVKTEIFTNHEKYHFFKEYEIGKIDENIFRNHIRELAGFNIENEKIDYAWNAMLQDIPTERIGWIGEAAKQYNCVVLSNTNSIHIKRFDHVFNQTTPYGLPKDLFQNLYYSFEIGERKPDEASFEIVLQQSGFDPRTTVLFDDLKENLETAKRLGMQTVYVERNQLRREQLPNGRI